MLPFDAPQLLGVAAVVTSLANLITALGTLRRTRSRSDEPATPSWAPRHNPFDLR
ncbi:hypothetical protein [Sphingomonas aerophila]|uniref:Uncharacterized protein n=1 Tax=Sphingomonas aerophila TaxID=1344948 RepID=A0A7W9EXJ5_9SPHN|nr:hypothetical protein [Sphingomonas aerophila]MBB5716902.1 hypothetical protein [Sphingomonas aerophila]